MQIERDAFWQGKLTVWQPARRQGYRFNLDSVLLASFCAPGEHILDLGSGCGIVPLLLLASGKAGRVTAVEVQPAMAALCRRNAVANGLADRITVICADLRTLAGEAVDGVVFNPPYFPANAGKPNPEPCRDHARNERHGTLADFVSCAARHLRVDGHVGAIVRAARADELHGYLSKHALGLTRQRQVLARATAVAAQHVLMQATAAAAPPACQLMPPLLVHRDHTRTFSSEIMPWINGLTDAR